MMMKKTEQEKEMDALILEYISRFGRPYPIPFIGAQNEDIINGIKECLKNNSPKKEENTHQEEIIY